MVRYDPIIRLAQSNDICIVIESEPSVTTSNMTLLHHFLEELNVDCVKALFDAGNEIADPLAPPPYPNGYELLKDHIGHVHLKDIRRSDNGSIFEPALIGEGDVNYNGLLAQLRADGYNGYVSLETHYRIRPEQMEDTLLVRPQGYAFSEGGESATRAYLDRLKSRYHWMEEA